MLAELEGECQRLLTTPKHLSNVPPHHIAQSIHAVIELLLSAASATSSSGSNTEAVSDGALLHLERAEGWCDVLDTLLRGSSSTSITLPSQHHLEPGSSVDGITSPVGRTSPLNIILTSSPYPLLMRTQSAQLKCRVFEMIRDVASASQQWPLAIRYAKKAHKLSEVIASVVHSVASRDMRFDDLRMMAVLEEKSEVSDADVLEFQRLSALYHPLRSAKNFMNLCVLVSKIKRHHDALQYAVDATNILRPMLEAAKTYGWLPPPQTNTGSTAEAATDPVDNHPGSLLAAALYNMGSQLELCQRGPEAMAAYDEALDLAEAYLGKKHPLSKQLRAIVSAAMGRAGNQPNSGRLPSVATTAAPSHFFAGSRSSRGRESSMDSKRQQSLAPVPPPRSASVGGAGEGSWQRRLSTAPSSQDAGSYSARPPSMGGRPPTSGSLDRGSATNGVARPVHLQPLSQIAVAGSRSHSSPSKGGWVDDISNRATPMKSLEPAVAVLDLSEAIRDHQRESQIPTEERLGSLNPSPLTSASGKRNDGLVKAAAGPVISGRGWQVIPPSKPQTQTQQGSVSRKVAAPQVGGSKVARSGSVPKRGGAGSAAASPSPSHHHRQTEGQHENQLLSWIQSVTHRQFDEYSRRFRSALVIQKAWRCSRARLERYNRRQILYHFLYLEQRAAVACIYAAYRAWSDHRRHATKRAIQLKASQERCERERKQQRAASTIVKAVRRFLRDVRQKRELMRKLRIKQEGKLVLYETASIIVQRWWKIIRVQKAYWRRRHAEILAERERMEVAAREGNAATKIQKVVRGHLGRQYAIRYRAEKTEAQKTLQRKLAESTDCVRIFLQEVRSRLNRLSMVPITQERQRVAAAQRIKEGWGQSLQRRAMHHSCHRTRTVLIAARVIQRCYRCFRARRDLRVARTISRSINTSRIEKEFRQCRAAVKIQCLVRQALARRRVAKIKASIGRRMFEATLRMQRICRGLLMRRQTGTDWYLGVQLSRQAMAFALEERHRLATLIQSFARAHLSDYLRALFQDAVEREDLLIARRTRREMFEDVAATKIQSLARMRHAQRIALQERQDLERQQDLWLAATIRLQCFFRVVKAKIILRARRVAMKKRMERLILQSQVAHEVFLTRVEELDRIEEEDRRHVEEMESYRRSLLESSFRSPSLPSSGCESRDVHPPAADAPLSLEGGEQPGAATAQQNSRSRQPVIDEDDLGGSEASDADMYDD